MENCVSTWKFNAYLEEINGLETSLKLILSKIINSMQKQYTSMPLLTLKRCYVTGKLGKHIKSIPFVTQPIKFSPFFRLGTQRAALICRIEHSYCLISTSYLALLFDIFILLHICEFWWLFLPMRTLCDAYHKEFEISLAFNPGHIWHTAKTHACSLHFLL